MIEGVVDWLFNDTESRFKLCEFEKFMNVVWNRLRVRM